MFVLASAHVENSCQRSFRFDFILLYKALGKIW